MIPKTINLSYTAEDGTDECAEAEYNKLKPKFT